mmetsp:Transcript_84046/g.216352  ORF Transcript_84046/g.216352 Transcript_84046/m.216352 type:complete len:645 (+) Transcript_84046:43-1977(+)
MLAPVPPSLPLRADVLLSNALFGEMAEDGITEEFLQRYTGCEDLEEVESLEMRVDAVSSAQRVECVGQLLPNLVQLKLSQSNVCTMRDLGTCLSSLRVLYLSRSSLQDLCGITAMPVLQELYVAFNDITDLSPLWTHEALQVLDLEGNLVEDWYEVTNLQSVATLRELNLSSNPIWRRENLTRERILEALPHLEVLDDMPVGWTPGEPQELLSVADSDEERSDELQSDPDILFIDQPSSPKCATRTIDELQGVCEEPAALQALRSRAGKPSRPEGAAPQFKRPVPPAPQAPVAAADGNSVSPKKPPPRGEGAPRRPTTSAALGAARSGHGRPATSAGIFAAPEPAEPRGDGEPSEQDLVVESLKRAPRPVPSLHCGMGPATARGDFARNRTAAGGPWWSSVPGGALWGWLLVPLLLLVALGLCCAWRLCQRRRKQVAHASSLMTPTPRTLSRTSVEKEPLIARNPPAPDRRISDSTVELQEVKDSVPPKPVACPMGHPLAKLGLKRDTGWVCNGRHEAGGCRSGIKDFHQSKGLHRHRCEECDYDLCQKCYHQRQALARWGSSQHSVGAGSRYSHGALNLDAADFPTSTQAPPGRFRSPLPSPSSLPSAPPRGPARGDEEAETPESRRRFRLRPLPTASGGEGQ